MISIFSLLLIIHLTSSSVEINLPYNNSTASEPYDSAILEKAYGNLPLAQINHYPNYLVVTYSMCTSLQEIFCVAAAEMRLPSLKI